MYDEKLDVCVCSLGKITIDERTFLECGVFQYKGGPKKLRVVKVSVTRSGEYRKSVVNVNRVEWDAIVKLVTAGGKGTKALAA